MPRHSALRFVRLSSKLWLTQNIPSISHGPGNCRIMMKGEDGYFRIARGKNACGIATAVTSAVLDDV